MRDVIRRIGVYLFVVTFVLSGATWAACIDLPAPAVAAAHSQHAAADDHSAHRHGGGGHLAAVPDQAPSHDHGPIKCCSMAPVFSLSPNLSDSPVKFVGAALGFHYAERYLTGHIVALEPGIPKTIV